MSRDKIDVQLVRNDNGNHYISLILNDSQVKGTFDAYDLIGTMHAKRMIIELLTCTCGVPGCAGIFEGTKIKHRKYSVEWRDIDSGLPKKFYSFDAENYKATVNKARDIMYSIAKERESGEVVADNIDRYDRFYRFNSVKELEDSLEYQKEWIKNYAIV